MLAIIIFLVLALVIRVVIVGIKDRHTPPGSIAQKSDQIEIDRDERIKKKRQEFKAIFESGFKKATTDFQPLFLFIDFETTDLPRDYKVPSKANLIHYPHIVQAASLVFNEAGELIDEFAAIIKTPEDAVFAPEAVNIHRITKEISQEQGVDIMEFLNFVSKYCHDQIYVVAHNAQFDGLFLQLEAKRNSVKLPRYKKYCTMKSTKELVGIFNYDYTKYKLPKLRELVEYAYFDSEHIKNAVNFHDAAADIKLCAMCFFELDLDKECYSCK